MISQRLGSLAMVAAMTAVLSLTGGLAFAADGDNANPESAGGKKNHPAHKENSSPGKPASEHLAAKKEMVRKQQEQRVTDKKRRAAAAALKAERLRVYNAKQAKKNATPQATENK